MKLYCILLVAAGLGYGQTKVNLPSQSRNVDFASFPATRPWKVSASLPATCLQGEALFLTSGAPGQQLYLCAAANAWSAASSAASQVFEAVKSASNVLQIGPTCSATSPCRGRYGDRVVELTAPATITLGGTPSTGTIFVWIDAQGIRAGQSGAATLTCNSACAEVAGQVTEFPIRSLPLAAVTYTGNVIDPITGGMDRRAFVASQNVEAGPSANLTVNSNGATGAVEVDLASTIDLGGFAATRVLRRGTSAQRPATCTVGDLYLQTNASAGIYQCLVADQWRGPLASLDALASVDARINLTAQTGDLSPVTVLAAAHPAGWYRICSAAAVTTPGTGTLDLVLTWRSPAQGTDLNATLASIAVTTPTEGWGCRIIRSTGAVAATLNPSDAGAAQYELSITAERLQ